MDFLSYYEEFVTKSSLRIVRSCKSCGHLNREVFKDFFMFVVFIMSLITKIFTILAITSIGLSSCSKDDTPPPINNSVDLDGTLINDSSLTFPEKFLQSAANVNPSTWDLEKPVVISVHGFSATTFEWTEFREFSKSKNSCFNSQVLLGAHGRDYADFKNGTWQQWQQPIIDEYNKLRTLGYKKIYFACSSTGCPLILDIIYNNKINPDVLKHIFLVDPVVVPSNKTMTLISAVGPALNYVETTMEKGEDGFWYKYRPYEAIEQLNMLTQEIRKDLESGITLPSNVGLTVYKSKKDGTADPMSAVLIKKGLKLSNGSDIEVQMIDSDIHVVTRLKGRNVISDKDIENQKIVFNHIIGKL